MPRTTWRLLLAAVCSLVSTQGHAAQPIFDEMPRWDGGWGVQLVQEYRLKRDLLEGTTPLGAGLREDAHILNIEGVYTWKKWIRATVKLPIVLDARRTVLSDSGERVEQHDVGLGNATLTVPLKHYFNLDGRSGSFTFAPYVIAPLGIADEYDVFRRHWALGFSTGVETETYRTHLGGGVSVRFYPDGRRPTEFNAFGHVGYNINVGDQSGHIKLKLRLHHKLNGTFTFSAGPIFYWKITDVWHVQARWFHDFYDHQGTRWHGNGDTFTLGAAVVF